MTLSPTAHRVHGLDGLCTTAQTVGRRRCKESLYTERRSDHGENLMLFIVGVVIVLVAVVVISRMLAPAGVNTADLGRMSEQWLSEHRSSTSHTS